MNILEHLRERLTVVFQEQYLMLRLLKRVDLHLVIYQLLLLERAQKQLVSPQRVMLLVQSIFKLQSQVEVVFVMEIYGMIPLPVVLVGLQYQMPQKQLIVILFLLIVHHQLL